MRGIIISLLFTIFLSNLKSQDSLTTSVLYDSLKEIEKRTDSLLKKQQDEIFKKTLEQNTRNLDAFVAEQKEREKRDRKRMYIRLGLGVFFFAVLIAGLLRRKKRKAQ